MLHTKKELVAMVNMALTGRLDPTNADHLEADDALFFWTMYGIGAAVILGLLSKEGGKTLQVAMNKKYDRLCGDYKSGKLLHDSVVRSWGKHSLCVTNVSRAIKMRDGAGTVEALMEALDAVTGDNVYFKIFKEATGDPDYKKKCQEAIFAHEKELTEKYGDDIRSEDYFHMLDDFFAANVRNRMGEWYEDFGEEPVTKLEKAEDQKAAADSVRWMYRARR